MGLYTSDRLKAMFQQSKERKQKERQQHKKEKQQQYQQLCKEADRLLKKAQEDAKRKKMEELQALSLKCSKKHSFEGTEPLKIYHSNLIERDSNDRDLFRTREELMAAEERGEGKLNWSKFDQLVNKVRKEICTILK